MCTYKACRTRASINIKYSEGVDENLSKSTRVREVHEIRHHCMYHEGSTTQ